MKENLKVILQAIAVIGGISFGILCLLVFGAAGLSWYYLLIPLSLVMFSAICLSIFKICEKDEIEEVKSDSFENGEKIIDVRFTDQKLQSKKLIFGGGGQISFSRNKINIIGMDHYTGEAGDIALSFIPLGSAVNTLQKERQKPKEIIIDEKDLEAIFYDISKGSFVILYQDYAFPFRVIAKPEYDKFIVASLLEDYYPSAFKEQKMPIEHKRLLILFAFFAFMAGTILFLVFVLKL